MNMGLAKKNISFDNPFGLSEFMYHFSILSIPYTHHPLTRVLPAPAFEIGNVPSNCMVLASVLTPDQHNHVYAYGTDKLRWDNCRPEDINAIRSAFGLPPVQGPASVAKIKPTIAASASSKLSKWGFI